MALPTSSAVSPVGEGDVDGEGDEGASVGVEAVLAV
ncbi:hypothetical protein N803_14050 [Knoellia subterranea KCTC 19937]|uniref:Uncharacterized protein n=1 Tax=Knoellia subterranea KCTC 19937 TaxID=1385521 RepID=A0A0A0JNI2_9MICO|nr:hypothetical protein N803_14050 [Knoellia subterranea KCTC 19937]